MQSNLNLSLPARLLCYPVSQRKNAALLLLLLLMAAALSSCGPSRSESAADAADEAAAIWASLPWQEPFQGLKIEGELLRIEDPSQPAVLRLPSGTELRVPAHCFLDEAGQPVSTPVEIRFREFHDAADIIASGIPMHAPGPDGQRGWLQTAGMFELRGQSDGRPIAIAPGQAVTVDLASKVDGPYDFWQFDEARNHWVNQGIVNTPPPLNQAAQEAAAEQQREIARLERLTARPPAAPQPTPEADKLVFSDLDTRLCPELPSDSAPALVYAGQEESKDPKNNSWITRPGIWRKKELKPAGEKGLYQLTLVGESVYSIPVKLALEGGNLEAAQAAYRAVMAEYQANLELLRERQVLMEQQAAFRRAMSVQGFGLYNYDVLWKMPDAIPLMANFDLGRLPEEVKETVTVYLVTGSGRTVIALPYSDWDRFRFRPDDDNKLLAVLPNDQVALFTQSDFQAALPELEQARGQRYVFKMRLMEQPLGGMADLRSLLDQASI
jgi:hypothetical protein